MQNMTENIEKEVFAYIQAQIAACEPEDHE